MTADESQENVQGIITTDLCNRLGTIPGQAPHDILQQLLVLSSQISAEGKDLCDNSQFSVMASLPGISSSLSECSRGLLGTVAKLLGYTSGGEVSLADAKDWQFVEDALDSVYARIDESLAADVGDESHVHKATHSFVSSETHVPSRPQDAWHVDNYRKVFVPILPVKLHAIEPLDAQIIESRRNPQVLESITRNRKSFPNVYEAEIRSSLKSEIKRVSELNSLPELVEPPSSLEDTPLVLVSSEASLDAMIEDIGSLREMALDVEHHDIHSYRGFTCLIQISTRSTDYIVDPFPLFSSLHKLNAVTTDPGIRKTLHGADMDIQWLQRDFGVYIVNMFDTGQAARVMGLAGGYGLANLLSTFFHVSTNKMFQMSDWRVRPLPADMLKYARLDTHYLLGIRDKMERLLVTMGGAGDDTVSSYGRKMFVQVLEKSAGIASKVYSEQVDDCVAEGDTICMKSPAMRIGSVRTNPKAMATLRGILSWRDSTAKKLDESKFHVLSNAAVLRLANAMPGSTAQLLRTLSYDHNRSAYMPSMAVSTAMADEIMAEIKKQWEMLEAGSRCDEPNFAARSGGVISPPPVAKASAGVVYTGGFGKVEKVSQLDQASVNTFSGGEKMSNVTSPLGKMFAAAILPDGMKSGSEETLSDIRAIITQMLEFVPPKTDSQNVDETPEEEAIPSEPMPLRTEFVPFQAVAPVPKRVDWDAGELPPTVAEQRRETSEKHSTQQNRKKQRNQDYSSAAAKALAFVEDQLSLGRGGK